MLLHRASFVSVAAAAALLCLTSSAWAQSATTGTIAGAVRDATGAVLPGVTVEASSPALIEKVRTVVSDASGNYKIVDLRPGTYAVVFTLTGFGTYRREGLELTTGVTANVSAEMKVGSLEETVTVTGASPVVDIQNVRTQAVLSREVIDAVPSNKTIQGFVTMIVGAVNGNPASQDVGGNLSESSGSTMAIHGNRAADLKMLQDGMSFNNYSSTTGSGSGRYIYANQAAVQEVAIQTSGMSAESESGGIQLNVVPKEGGNAFKGYFAATGAKPGMSSDNLDDELRARGITVTPKARSHDWGGAVGGPIKRDRLWFYTAHRWWGAHNDVAGNFWNANQGHYAGSPDSGVGLYVPDLSRPAYYEKIARAHDVRLTWQAAPKHKVNVSFSAQDNCSCFLGVEQNRSPENATEQQFPWVTLTQATWSNPQTNRLLFEAGATVLLNDEVVARPPGVSTTDISITELSTGYQYGSKTGAIGITSYNANGIRHYTNQSNGRASMSYVTGSHAFKAGLQWQVGEQYTNGEINRSVDYTFRNNLPQSLTEWASPLALRNQVRGNLAPFAQDQWTIHRLTLNLGLRFDHLRAVAASEPSAAGRFVGERVFPTVVDVPNWNDIGPRLGAAYDVFGNGRTAIKGSVGRYVISEAITLAQALNPTSSMVTSATRTWADANGNYVPDCDLVAVTANGECGALNNTRFGTVVISRRFDPAILKGWDVRPYDWQASASVQQELRSGMGVSAGYFRTWYGNFTATSNTALTPADFSEYCVTAPVAPALGAASGARYCGLYDVNPSRFGQADSFVTQASAFGPRTEVYDGIDIAMNAKFGKGGLVQGGMNTGRTAFDNCAVLDTPQAARPGFCRTMLPLEGQTQFKVSGIYPLPWWGVQASGTYQNMSGIPIAANRTYTNAEIAPSLGRNLSAGAGSTVTVALLEPNRLFEHRLTQLDVRLTKVFTFGRTRVQGMFDVYNALNANTVLGINTTYGPQWLRPTTVLAGRLFKFAGQLDF